ncbi:MAG TPA: HlyD family secretion protein [Opitutales bacterium]|nr:HlyD family secretion protein [Opitutales bacterium]
MNAMQNADNLIGPDRPELTGLRDRGTATHTNGHRLDASNAQHHNPPLTQPPRTWLKRLAFGMGLLAAIAVGTAIYEIKFAPYESTDDAFIEGHVTTIAPQVSGLIVKLLVQDNQAVTAGQVLAEIDSQDYDVKLAQARASLAEAQSGVTQAQAQLAVDQAKADEESASVAAAQADATRAVADQQRYESIDTRAVARSQVDLAEDQAHAATAQLQVAQSRARAAAAQVELGQAGVTTAQAAVQQAETAVQQAQLDLSYTEITAPEAGYVTHRAAEVGAYAQPGQPLLAIVPAQVWVIANFKETQLTDMRPGQPVEIYVDAYPQHKFAGHVDSVQAGSGARFSLLPPENATGNYVKVVQRVPVKIVFDEKPDPAFVLGPGMSVTPSVKVR